MSIGNITYQSWKTKTRTAKPRSAQLRALDKAIEQYCKMGGGTPGNLEVVKAKFSAWKGSSSERINSTRNASGIVTELDLYLTGKKPMTNAYLDSQQDGRLGLLYVFGGLDVDARLFNLVIDSAWELGGAGFSFEGTQKDLQSAFGSSMTASQAKTASKLPGQVFGSGLAKKGLDAGVAKVQGAHQARQNRGQPPTPPPRPAPGNVPGGPLKRGNPATGGAFRVKKGMVSSRDFETTAQLPPTAIEQFGQKAIDAITKPPPEEPYDFFKDWGTRIAGLIKFIVGKILGEAGKTVMPIVGGGIKIAEGIADTIGACIKKYETWAMSKKANIAPGHPTAVVEGIKVIQSAGIGKGLYDTLKGAAQLGLDVGAAASGTIFGLITTCVEVLAKFIHRLWDVGRLESFSRKCKAMYDANKDVVARGQPGTLPRAGEFGQFLRGYVMTCPSIACVAMVSGYAGDAMQWVDMNSTFNKGDQYSAAEWKAGNADFDAAATNFQDSVKLLTHLKGGSREYLSASGFSFRHKDASLARMLTAENLKKPSIGMLDATKGSI